MNRLEVLREARERAKSYRFGDQVTNVCAGDGNPRRHALYVSHGKNTVKCTNGKGSFWDTGIEVVFPGKLHPEKCKELFSPIWQAIYVG
jgi:hypothetical protein